LSPLKAKKMSQRQPAQQPGNHSTISRLIRGDRMPLGTATKLAAPP
jgi:hypothetical protein